MTLPYTMPGRLAWQAEHRGSAVALREKRLGVWEEITWEGYRNRMADVARMLEELGVGPGDHVGILSDNRTEWLFCDLGSQLLGARSAGIYQTNPPKDVAYVLNHANCKVLFCEDQEQVDKAIEVADQTPTVSAVVVFDPQGLRHYTDSRLMPWDVFLEKGAALRDGDVDWLPARLEALRSDEPAMVVYTSGTTGQPKGAMLTGQNLLSAADELVSIIGSGPDDLILSYLPLCHVAEKIFSLTIPLSSGAVVHFGESIYTIQQDLREVSPTIFLGVPRIWEKIHAGVVLKMKDATWLKRSLFAFAIQPTPLAEQNPIRRKLADLLIARPLQERLGLRRCRVAVSGAAPIAPELIKWFRSIGVPLLEGYGMTESAGVSHVNPPDGARVGSVGVALSTFETKIAGDGEILVRGPSVFAGYLHNEEATQETIDADGWLHTGDVGQEDDDGYLRITGRKKEIIITAGGKNLSPEKIENALKTSPYIKEVVSVGDARKFISALIQIDADAVGDWAGRRELAFTDFADLSRQPGVLSLIDNEIRQANQLLAQVEQVRVFRLFDKELHQDDGEMTATQKIRRRAVMEIWASLIDDMYGGT